MFKRNASGLVKGLKMKDVFMYNSLTISLFSMMWFLLFIYQPIAFNAGSIIIGTALLSAVSVPFFITYSYLSRSYPWAGGDYIFQSRALHPAVGFVLTFTGWVIWQLFFIAWFGYYIVDALLLPYLYLMYELSGSPLILSIYKSVSSSAFVFIITAILLILAFLISMKGIKFYAKFQYIIFALMMAGGASALAILFTNARYFAPSLSLVNINWLNTFGTWSLSWGAIGYGMWSVLNNEEITGLESHKTYSAAMIGAVLLNVFFITALWIGLKATFGYVQLSQLSQMWLDGKLTGMLAAVGAPYYTALIALLRPNPVLYTILIVGAAISMFQVMIAIMIGSSRIVLAQSLDGILPIKLATVQDRSHSPIYSLIFDLIISLMWLVLIVFTPTIGPFFVSVVFATQITWMASMAAGIVISLKEKNFKILIASVIGFVLNAIIALFYVIYPQLGFVSITSILVVSGVFAIAFIYYIIRNLYLKKNTGFSIEDRVKEL